MNQTLARQPGHKLKNRKTSALWKYFTVKDSNSVTCNTCKIEIRTARNHGSTSNLIRHLKNRHKEVYDEFRSGQEITRLEPDIEVGLLLR